jgi:hypothetical protein
LSAEKGKTILFAPRNSGCVTKRTNFDRTVAYSKKEPSACERRCAGPINRKDAHRETSLGGRIFMKRFAFFTGFVLLTTAIAVPFFLLKKGTAAGQDEEDNIRYDIDDYMASEGL